MGGPHFDSSFMAGGHGPSSVGGAGSQFPARFDDVQRDFSKLNIDDQRGRNDGPQISKSTTRVSFNTPKGDPIHYEYYAFTKDNDWRVAHKTKIAAPQEELEKTVLKGKRKGSILEALKKMSSDRRAHIDRLLAQKNHGVESRDAQWYCAFIDSPGDKIKEVGGKRILEHKKMDVIIAQPIAPGRAKSTSQERKKSFAGEGPAINDPILAKDQTTKKDKQSKAGQEGKEGNGYREDPFDIWPLFNDRGIPMDKHGPVTGFPSQHQRFDPRLGQPSGLPGGQPMPNFHPTGPAGNPISGHPFSQPTPGPQPPHGIQIIDDPVLPQSGANNVINVGDFHPPGQGPLHPHDQPPHFQPHRQKRPQHNQPPHLQQPHINDFNGPNVPHRKRQIPPLIIHDQRKGRPAYTKKWMEDDSSHESEDEFPFSDDDECSSHTSYTDDGDKLVRRGSLIPHRRSSNKRREPVVYREHRRGSSYPTEPPPSRRPEHPRRDSSRYHGERGETIIERRPRRHSSRERRERIKYTQPQRLEYLPRSPPMTPRSTSSYSPTGRSPARRFSGLLYPHELVEREREKEKEREREHERQAEEYMHEKHMKEREEDLRRREMDLEERIFLERSSSMRERFGGAGRQDRYWAPR